MDNLMEDHQLVFVVASGEKEARKAAKQKWTEAESIHVDGTQLLQQVDGFKIELRKTRSDVDQSLTDNLYSD